MMIIHGTRNMYEKKRGWGSVECGWMGFFLGGGGLSLFTCVIIALLSGIEMV